MTRCRDCDKPIATDADYDTMPEGQGDHLCWRDWNCGVCFHPEIDWRARYLAILPVAEAAELLVSQPMIAKGDAATWGDVAQSHSEGPRLLGRLVTAIDAYRKSKETA